MRFALRLALVLAFCGVTVLAQSPNRRGGLEIRISEPANQAVVFGKTKIVAEVKIDRPEKIDRVEFLVGDDVIFVDREPPYECVHDFGEEAKSWIIRAVAHHVEEVQVTDAVITRKIAFIAIENVDRVVLWVSATDDDGEFVKDLSHEDVSVFEGEREQKVDDFFHEDRPISLGILLDSSGSMKERLREVHKAASAFVDTLRDEDQALLIDFDDRVYLIQDLTSDRERLKDAIVSTEAIGGTALYDVLHATYRKIGSLEGRKAIIVLSDGEDTASQNGFQRVLEEAKSNNTIIYAIGLGAGPGGPRKNVLREFAEVTGGRAFFVKRASELAEVYQKIAEDLRTQYFVAYTTDNEDWDGRWIRLKVKSERPGLKIRARRGYFAVRKSRIRG